MFVYFADFNRTFFIYFKVGYKYLENENTSTWSATWIVQYKIKQNLRWGIKYHVATSPGTLLNAK